MDGKVDIHNHNAVMKKIIPVLILSLLASGVIARNKNADIFDALSTGSIRHENEGSI